MYTLIYVISMEYFAAESQTLLLAKRPSVAGGGTLGISGCGCAAGTLEPLT